MAKGNSGKPAAPVSKGNDRPNHKAFKKNPMTFDPIKRKLVSAK
jgi:hypothetical protein